MGILSNGDHLNLAGLWIILMVGGFIQANDIGDGTIFLERDHPGILSCPLVASGRIPLYQIEVMYWYSPVLRDENILISYFLGNVAPQNGIPEGVYDINRNFSLVIENVTDSKEGTYYCRVKPRLRMVVDGQVTMGVKVSPKEPFPDVTQCTERISGTACEAEFSNDIKKPMLTCIVQDAKPAVALRWLLEYSDGDTKLISDRFTIKSSEMNTFTTSAFIPIVASSVDRYMYRCQAYGEALGARNGSHVTVTAFYTLQTPHFTAIQPTTALTVMPKFGFEPEVKDAPDISESELIRITDAGTSDGYQIIFIATAVAFCLSLTVIVALVIAVCKIKKNNEMRFWGKTVMKQAERV